MGGTEDKESRRQRRKRNEQRIGEQDKRTVRQRTGGKAKKEKQRVESREDKESGGSQRRFENEMREQDSPLAVHHASRLQFYLVK